MKRVIEPLQKMGAEIDAQNNNQFAPIAISGKKLNSMEYSIPIPSAQVKTALILAGLLAHGKTAIHEKMPTRDHTERMLRYLGVNIASPNGSLAIVGHSEIESKDIFIPGDISSAFYFIGAGLLVKNSHIKIKNVGLNPSRIGALRVLKRMGAEIEIKTVKEINCEPFGEIEVKTSALQATEILPEEIPSLIDEIPLLAVIACLAEGKTAITGAGELRVKETDRLKAIASELKKMGANIRELPDGLKISGPAKLKGASVESLGDHRMAMALSVAGLVASGETMVDNEEVVDVSFPNFFEILDGLTKK
jgi:3-phosphoshikimate 1-carboxyvinyltransferase